jgi:hypothetical protein
MRKIKGIVVHCSGKIPFGNPLLFNDWHRRRNFKKSFPGRPGEYNCGYHAVITNGVLDGPCEYDRLWDGNIMSGRPEELSGAHATNCNSTHLGVCLAGGYEFTDNQLESLHRLVEWWMQKFGLETDSVIGHNETPHQQKKDKHSRKTCPNIPMHTLRSYLEISLPGRMDMAELQNAIKSHNLLEKR